jgi:hypothetical protein
MTAELPQAELDRIRNWTGQQLAGGRELPWRAFLLTRLGETIDALLDGMANAQPHAADVLTMRSTPRLVVSNPVPSERPPTAKPRPGYALRSGRLTKTLATGPVA